MEQGNQIQPQESVSRLEQFLQKNKYSLFLALAGFAILSLGVLGFKLSSSQENQIEILTQETQEAEAQGTIFIDLAGAVQNPGVYELKANSRVNDLLIAAGGLSAEADRVWIARSMNLAQKLVDGVKIYIPTKGETSGNMGSLSNLGTVAGSTATGLVNINTASVSQLDTLWGIGPATAEKIITGRPYQSTEELRAKKIVKSNVWEAIKDKITVY